ncbi:hypothetical protein TSH64_01380 [Azospirillum sp. TSH64]|nr:hypothetical protein TSH64_01525 [Azospirillum sp. TSH64]PWC81142.1 hypothetical protein TSH64_01380 [Azospirillum sp. TSH64]
MTGCFPPGLPISQGHHVHVSQGGIFQQLEDHWIGWSQHHTPLIASPFASPGIDALRDTEQRIRDRTSAPIAQGQLAVYPIFQLPLHFTMAMTVPNRTNILVRNFADRLFALCIPTARHTGAIDQNTEFCLELDAIAAVFNLIFRQEQGQITPIGVLVCTLFNKFYVLMAAKMLSHH